MTAYRSTTPSSRNAYHSERGYDSSPSPNFSGGFRNKGRHNYHDHENRGNYQEQEAHYPQQEDEDDYEYDDANGQTTPRIPKLQRIESGKENDGLLGGFSEQIGAFESMCSAGAGWGSALAAVLQGHKMTEEQAAICLQSHWRRHEAAVRAARMRRRRASIASGTEKFAEKLGRLADPPRFAGVCVCVRAYGMRRCR